MVGYHGYNNLPLSDVKNREKLLDRNILRNVLNINNAMYIEFDVFAIGLNIRSSSHIAYAVSSREKL